MEHAIETLLSTLHIRTDLIQQFTDWSHHWMQEMSGLPHMDTKAIHISEIEQQLETLTGKLVSGVIDDDTYTRIKRKLDLQKQAQDEQHLMRRSRAENRSNAIRFLELLQTLGRLYEMAKPHEKRQMVELCFSNRTVHQKSVDLTTHSWLETAST